MSATLTVRTSEELRATLERRAGGLGKSVSELVREILEERWPTGRLLSQRVTSGDGWNCRERPTLGGAN